jgi:hypothetical protein
MGRWGLLGVMLCYIAAEGGAVAQASAAVPILEDGAFHLVRAHKKKKKKPAKPKKRKPKGKLYSAQHIEKLLENDQKEEVCNRLNCASNLRIAKSCLKTRASYRKKKKCFRAFCAYGCNDEDYQNKPDVYEFCNRTCSSKKYGDKKKRAG